MVRLAVAERGRKEAGEKRRVPSRLAPRLPDAGRERISAHHATHRAGADSQGAGDRARHMVHPLSQDRKLR